MTSPVQVVALASMQVPELLCGGGRQVSNLSLRGVTVSADGGNNAPSTISVAPGTTSDISCACRMASTMAKLAALMV